jgi:flagellar hook-basal body complex protein FliE
MSDLGNPTEIRENATAYSPPDLDKKTREQLKKSLDNTQAASEAIRRIEALNKTLSGLTNEHSERVKSTGQFETLIKNMLKDVKKEEKKAHDQFRRAERIMIKRVNDLNRYFKFIGVELVFDPYIDLQNQLDNAPEFGQNYPSGHEAVFTLAEYAQEATVAWKDTFDRAVKLRDSVETTRDTRIAERLQVAVIETKQTVLDIEKSVEEMIAEEQAKLEDFIRRYKINRVHELQEQGAYHRHSNVLIENELAKHPDTLKFNETIARLQNMRDIKNVTPKSISDNTVTDEALSKLREDIDTIYAELCEKCEVADAETNIGWNVIDMISKGIEENDNIFSVIADKVSDVFEVFYDEIGAKDWPQLGDGIIDGISEGLQRRTDALLDAFQAALDAMIAAATC